MKGFIRDQDMTWPVAFSKQNLHNPDYNVHGIPHVVIFDVEGRVRYNGLNPNLSTPAEEAQKIDALLKEAGLKCPVKPLE